jgi:predicted nuclease with TOPRIM domain
MPLFENIEKLINEHGSAAILRERLLLASDKYAALEAKTTQLEKEKDGLQADAKKAAAEIDRLRKLVEQKHGKLSDEEEKILKVYAEAHTWIPVSAIAHHLEISQMKAQYFVERLLQGSYLQSPMMIVMDQEVSYHIHHKGREYVIQHGLVS